MSEETFNVPFQGEELAWARDRLADDIARLQGEPDGALVAVVKTYNDDDGGLLSIRISDPLRRPGGELAETVGEAFPASTPVWSYRTLGSVRKEFGRPTIAPVAAIPAPMRAAEISERDDIDTAPMTPADRLPQVRQMLLNLAARIGPQVRGDFFDQPPAEYGPAEVQAELARISRFLRTGEY